MQSLLILGRQPELGLAELESLYGYDKVNKVSDNVAIVDIDPCLLTFQRLGGSQKFAKLLTEINTINWSDIENFLIKTSPKHSEKIPPGKMTLGLSLYGFDIKPNQIYRSALSIKRAIVKTGRSVRLVPNKSADLNTAQVIYNKLTSNRSWEILIIKSDKKTYIAQTIMVQDIKGYSERDQARPYRDPKVGMLPPKLAQIMINLSVGKLDQTKLQSICQNEDTKLIPNFNQTILDPFCGTGVILQEASLMGYKFIGSDLNPKMVDYSRKNLEWLTRKNDLNIKIDKISVADATNNHWPRFDFIASETNLGKPLSSLPPKDILETMIQDLNQLINGFLINIAKQSSTNLRLCIGIPAWQINKNDFRCLPIIDHLENIGYNLIDFKHINNKQLIYYRPNQTVARQLIVIKRK